MEQQEYHDYRDDEPQNRIASKSRGSNRTLLFVLLGASGFLLLCCGGIIAAVIWGVSAFAKDLPEVQGVADEFFDSLKSGDLNGAYERTSGSYRAQNTPERFAAFIKQYETLTKHTTRTMNGFNIFSGTGGKQARIQMTLQAPNNATTCTLILVPEDGAWKISQIMVP